MDSLIIIGADVCAIEAYLVAKDAHPDVEIVFAEDVTGITEVIVAGEAVPVVKDWDFKPFRRKGLHGRDLLLDQFIIGGSNPPIRKKIAEKALSFGLQPAPTIIHPHTWVARHGVEIGRGGIILPFCVIDLNSKVGDFVYMLSNSGIGHDCNVGHFVNFHPGATLNSTCTLGDGVELSTGCTVLNNIKLADNVRVAANACVTKSIDTEGITVMGVPARARPNTSGQEHS